MSTDKRVEYAVAAEPAYSEHGVLPRGDALVAVEIERLMRDAAEAQIMLQTAQQAIRDTNRDLVRVLVENGMADMLQVKVGAVRRFIAYSRRA